MAEPAATFPAPVRRAALDALGLTAAAPSGAALALRPLPDGARLNLRLDSAERGNLAAVESAGWVLPLDAGAVWEGADGRRALWLGPDEWLLLTALDDRGGVLSVLAGVLGGRHHALVDLSDNYAAIGVSGHPAPALLAKGCPLDLDRRAFPPDRVAQSLIGKADAIIERRADDADDAPRYEITVRRSFARYTWEWLADGAREFGLAIVP